MVILFVTIFWESLCVDRLLSTDVKEKKIQLFIDIQKYYFTCTWFVCHVCIFIQCRVNYIFCEKMDISLTNLQNHRLKLKIMLKLKVCYSKEAVFKINATCSSKRFLFTWLNSTNIQQYVKFIKNNLFKIYIIYMYWNFFFFQI